MQLFSCGEVSFMHVSHLPSGEVNSILGRGGGQERLRTYKNNFRLGSEFHPGWGFKRGCEHMGRKFLNGGLTGMIQVR